MSNKFTMNKTIEFIEEWEKHECLWKPEHEFYKNAWEKSKAYEDLATKSKIGIDAVKKKIKSLRTQISENKKKQCAGSRINPCKWVYWNSLKFIRNVMDINVGFLIFVSDFFRVF